MSLAKKKRKREKDTDSKTKHFRKQVREYTERELQKRLREGLEQLHRGYADEFGQ